MYKRQRLYSGAKYQTAEAVSAGQVCALLGLTQTYPGQGLGAEPPAPPELSHEEALLMEIRDLLKEQK